MIRVSMSHLSDALHLVVGEVILLHVVAAAQGPGEGGLGLEALRQGELVGCEELG